MRYLLTLLTFASAVFDEDIKLPSRRVLKNAQIGPIVYTTGIPSSLALKYETAADIRSKKAITEEVTEIWQSFRIDAEKGKYSSAVIMVVGPSSGLFIRTAEQRNFVFEKKDGAWQMGLPSVWQEKKPNQSPEPTR